MPELRCHCGSTDVTTIVRLVPRRECGLSHRHDALHAYGTAYDQPSCAKHVPDTLAAGTVVGFAPIAEGAA